MQNARGMQCGVITLCGEEPHPFTSNGAGKSKQHKSEIIH